MAVKNYYTVLGLQPGAGLQEIKKAYRQLAFRYHPDHNRGGTSGEERFRQIKEAYEILCDPVKRKYHDASLKQQLYYAPTYDFGKYARPPSPENMATSVKPAAARKKEHWLWLIAKPLLLILVALLLMRLIMMQPHWLKSLLDF
jgi:curved DNA-binding protein CbpA